MPVKSFIQLIDVFMSLYGCAAKFIFDEIYKKICYNAYIPLHFAISVVCILSPIYTVNTFYPNSDLDYL